MNKDELREYLTRDAEALRTLNFSENYIRQTLENTQKWGRTGLLGGIKDPHIGRQVARLLENQRILNETWPGDVSLIPEGAQTSLPIEDWAAQWRRVSIPVMRRTFGPSFPGYELVSVQVMKSGQENTYHTDYAGKTVATMTEASTRQMKARWEPNNEGKWSLDEEAEATARFSEQLSLEFGREICTDLRQNAGSKAKYPYENEAQVLSLIEGMSAYIGAKTQGRDATWVVASPVVVRLLGEHIETDLLLHEEREGFNYVGTLAKNWKLFEDSLAPTGHILMGHKDSRNHYFSGYVFAPFLPVNPTPSWWTESQHGHGRVLARYGKRLSNPGFYGVIQVEGLPEPTATDAPKEEGEGEA
jgi:hypothetical protein